MVEPSLSTVVDAVEPRTSLPKEESNSTSSDPVTDPEDHEITDDDDDDRNHKHRRREPRPQSFDNNVQEQPLRPNRKRSRPLENGQLFSGTYSHGDLPKEYSSKSEKRRYGMSMHDHAPSNLGSRARVNQSFFPDPAPHLDLSASSVRPPVGRGRGRNIIPWGQHDPRFTPLDTIDFASRMASQGHPTHPSMFAGAGLPSGASSQNGSWGAYGVISGMTNRIMDPIHPLSLQGALQPTIAPLMNLGMPRQRCRDFEERGFCLRGDMCPMEHGVNRIVVEDVQSLSQFNLPVSIPSHHQLGSQARTGSIPPVSTSSTPLTSSKAVPIKDNNSVGTDDASKLNGISSASAVVEADVYDPDQPLWNNEQPETSHSGFRLPSLNNVDESVWDADSSTHQGIRLSSDTEREAQSHVLAANVGPQTTNSSVWGRIRSRNRSEAGRVTNTNVTSTSYLGNQMKEEHEDATPGKVQGNVAAKDMTVKAPSFQLHSRMHGDLGHHGGRTSQRASRTLYINGIPQKNNKREAIFSHFQKFGEVIDIYIPHNSEKAFVQFSKREEAEAALKAPDAVMGNRFIKLWWANRDRISDQGESRVHSTSLQLLNMEGSSALAQPSDSDRGRENLPSATPKTSNGSSEKLVPTTGPFKGLSANGSEATIPVQKKLESLELLEELRKKQEILAQKRDEFRRQLDKLAKQTTSGKKGESAGKGKKLGTAGEDAKVASSRPENVSAQGTNREAGYALERNSEDVFVSPTLKANSTNTQQTPKSMKRTTHLPAFSQNRFKLDNRPTSFRVLSPLPTEITEVSVLRDHFSSFGDVSSIVLEDMEAHSENASLNSSQNCTACVTFTTRQAAERAYATGKSWKGHTLRFSWLTESPSSNSNYGIQETSTPTGASSTKIHVEQVTTEKPSLPAGRLKCSAIMGEPVMNVESTKSASITISNDLAHAPVSSHSVSSFEECPEICDVSPNVDNNNTSFSK
ncbi:zinc finger CCCH domain-containing protein 27 [Typha latifolia]|uniref:zinc finger CCCH domain-containing protein 27 n=1 Tax=Typha latifolia TaxID=4733 RepID=UPI003C2CB2E6